MNNGDRLNLRLGSALSSLLLLSFLNFPPSGFAEDPIVVHYSDPSLTRMEAQIGVNAAQKDRFEDIVVKYRDPLSNPDADNSGQRTTRSGRHSGGRSSTQNASDADGTDSLPRRGKGQVTRNELDELATILTPAQIKKFQDLNEGPGKKRHSS
jgi:hypothetical protein